MTRISRRRPLFMGSLGSLGLLVVLALPLSLTAQDSAEEGEEIPYSRRGADTCMGCHDDPSLLGIFKTPHAQRADERAPFAPGQLQCEACHGPGGNHTKRVRPGEERPAMPFFAPKSAASVEDSNEVCLGCHEDHVTLSWAGSTHDVEDVACADCHQVHSARDAALHTETQPGVCYDCHVQQKADSAKPFTHPVRFGRMACTACHSPHGSSADYLLVRNSTNETCYTCHQDKRGPLLWEHAPVTEDCSYCHKPHGSIHPALLTKRPPLLCQQCHSQAGHPSVPYTSSGLADGTASPMLLSGSCLNCHAQVHGSNHPSGPALQR